MSSRETLGETISVAEAADLRLERLIALERHQVQALAAHIRYVESVLATAGGAPPPWLREMGERLDAQVHRLEELETQLRDAPPRARGSKDDDDLDLLFARARGPLGTLAEEFNLRAASLGCALDEADELDDGRVTKVLREHLHELERDLESLRKRVGRE